MKPFLKLVAAFVVALMLVVAVAYQLDRAERLAALEAGSRVLQTALGPVEYRLDGDASDPLLVVLHGTPGGHDQGIEAEPGVRVLSLSRPGYLRTPLSSGVTPQAQAELLRALLDELGFDRVVLMGISGGGPSAYSFASAYPERTRALIAMEAVSKAMPIDPDEPAPPQSDLLLWLALRGLELSQDDLGVVETFMADDPDFDRLRADPAALAEVASLVWTLWPMSRRGEGFFSDLDEMTRFDLDLSTIRAPTLIVHGTRDDSVPFEHAEHAAAQITGSTLHAVEGAGHMMPFAHADEVDAAVEAFLASLPPLDAP